MNFPPFSTKLNVQFRQRNVMLQRNTSSLLKSLQRSSYYLKKQILSRWGNENKHICFSHTKCSSKTILMPNESLRGSFMSKYNTWPEWGSENCHIEEFHQVSPYLHYKSKKRNCALLKYKHIKLSKYKNFKLFLNSLFNASKTKWVQFPKTKLNN